MTDTAYADLPRSRREWAEDLVRRLRSESHAPPLRGRWLAYDSDDAFVAEHPKSSLVHYLDLYQTLYDAETLKTAIVEAKLFGPGIKAASRAKVLGGVACEGRQVSINATTKVNFLCIGAVPPWTPQEQLREWPYDLRPCCMRHDPHRWFERRAAVELRAELRRPPTPPPSGRITPAIARALEAVADLSEQETGIFMLALLNSREPALGSGVTSMDAPVSHDCGFARSEKWCSSCHCGTPAADAREEIRVRYACWCAACWSAEGARVGEDVDALWTNDRAAIRSY